MLSLIPSPILVLSTNTFDKTESYLNGTKASPGLLTQILCLTSQFPIKFILERNPGGPKNDTLRSPGEALEKRISQQPPSATLENFLPAEGFGQVIIPHFNPH